MRVFSIVGPTGVGKTEFVLHLAKEILRQKKYAGVDLVSVDSRQVYQGLEVTSGADVPDDFQQIESADYFFPYFQKKLSQVYEDSKIGEIFIHGALILQPSQEWSLAHFQKLVQEVVQRAIQKNHLVILIGGTGLYHTQAFPDPDEKNNFTVKPNQEIREKSEKMSLKDLQHWAERVNRQRFKELNHSDVHNPRRLVRVIEQGLAIQQKEIQEESSIFQADFLPRVEQKYFGLQQDLEKIEQKIQNRVEKRINQGAIVEVESLLVQYTDPSLSALSALGVKEIQQFLQGKIDLRELQDIWSLHEFQYAKRQLTWWKKWPVKWLGVSEDSGWQEEVIPVILNVC